MTRINVIPVSELSDQHLIAEYHELPRVLKQNVNISDASEKYLLGKGHVKWARKHSMFIAVRFADLVMEMNYRGFKAGYDGAWSLLLPSDCKNFYEPTNEDIELNRKRIKEKYNMKPEWYRWTKRNKPEWLK